MHIYLSRNDQTFGPYSIEQVREMLRSNAVFAMDLACCAGEDQWKPLYQVVDAVPVQSPAPTVASLPNPKIEQSGGAHPVSEEDIALFAGKSIDHYVKGWKTLRASKLNIWGNHTAGFLGVFWLLYRKMYLWAFFFAGIFIAWGWFSGVVGLPLSVGDVPLIILSAFFADRIYLSRAEKRIMAIKTQYSSRQDQRERIASAGGTNLLAAIIPFGMIAIGSLVIHGLALVPDTKETSPKQTGSADPATPSPKQEESKNPRIAAIEQQFNPSDVKELAAMPSRFIANREIIAMKADDGKQTVPPPGAHWNVAITEKSLGTREGIARFDFIFSCKKDGNPCVIAHTTTNATYLFAMIDDSAALRGVPGRNGATCYFQAIGTDNSVSILLR
jgi:hypothetical protein